jgi:glycosyltransferase involved in cell wall biosynthesis
MVSSPETFGLVYLESLASGCITVGSKNEGIDGIIINEKNGFLVKPRDSDALLKVIQKILSIDNYFKTSLVLNGIETAKGFSDEKVAKNYLKEISI